MSFNSKNIPLYTYDKKNKKYLRTLFEEKLNEHLIKECEKIYTFFNNAALLKELNHDLIKMHLMYQIKSQDYYKIRNKFLCEFFNKKIKKNNNYKFKIIFIVKKFFKFFFFTFFLTLYSFFPPKKKNYIDVIIQIAFSAYKNSKEEFPFYESTQKKKKFTSLYLDPKCNSIYFFFYQWSSFFSENLKKKFYKILKFFFTNPYKISLLIDFFIYHHIYFSIFKSCKPKIYVHSLSFDDKIPAIRQAAENSNVKVIGFKRSNYHNKTVTFLSQPEEILFDWGKNDKEIDKKSNVIKKKYKIFPSFFLGIRKKIKKKYTVVTLFDTTLHHDGFVSEIDFNKFLNIVLNEVIKNKKIFLQIKLKTNFSKFDAVIDISNKNILDEIVNQKRIKIFNAMYMKNNNIIANSDLVCSINSLTIGYESLANKVDSLTFCNKDHDPIFIKKLNKIHFFATSNINEFSKMFKKKVNNKRNNFLINKLHNYFFSGRLSDPVVEIHKYL
jgi:hypothetical protein